MYLTAQRIRGPGGDEDVHAFLHLHDLPACPFPAEDPLSVPEGKPGRLVAHSQQRLTPGGNAVVAYLDVIAADGIEARSPS